jgi:hypothetical protein
MSTKDTCGVRKPGAGAGLWRAINGPQLVALVRAGATFKKGVLVANPDQVAA